ncbi:hypothetical protein GCM10027020_33940 [Nocardioides salsibiostraticola]
MVIPIGIAAGAVIGGIGNALKNFGLDDDTIDPIITFLTEGLNDLPEAPADVKPGEFGNLVTGQQMAYHTANARQFMLETYEDMRQILSSRAEDVEAFARDTEDVDLGTSINLLRLRTAVTEHGAGSDRGDA